MIRNSTLNIICNTEKYIVGFYKKGENTTFKRKQITFMQMMKLTDHIFNSVLLGSGVAKPLMTGYFYKGNNA